MRKTLGCIRKAVKDYNMINDGDHICVAVSGGKDSMLLLKALKTYMYFSPEKFKLTAICIDVGFDNMQLDKLETFCDEIQVPLEIVHTDIKKIVFDERKEKNPCSLCSKMKRAALNETALKLGSNKIAFGHHRDDFIESFLLSLFYEGRIHTFKPVTYLDRTGVYSLRPLLYAKEKDVIHAVRTENIPIIKSECPADGFTKREEMKNLVKYLKKQIPNADERMFTAIKNNLENMK